MTMRKRACFAGAMMGVVALTASAPASAQTRLRHEGFNAAIGIGFGTLRTSCSECVVPARDGALQFTARGGWTISDAFIFTGDVLVFQKHIQDGRGNDVNTNFYALTGDVLWYPSRRWDIFLKVGAGVSNASVSLDFPALGPRHVIATAPVLRVGIGTDLGLGRTWSLTPYLDYLLGLNVRTKIDGRSIRSSMLLFGAAVTWP